jgi:hypothetical protein
MLIPPEDAATTAAACDMTDAELMAAQTRARETVAGLLTGAALEVQSHTYELIIINPRDLGKGRIHVDYANGGVSRERIVWDECGVLPGYNATGTPGTVIADTIRDFLNARVSPEEDREP